MNPAVRIGTDIGGTFTDIVLVTGSGVHLEKVLSTPIEPARAVIEGVRSILKKADVPLHTVSTLVHGTTLVTNTLIERTGKPTALLHTEGFRDVLEIGNADRYDIYDLQIEKPEPLSPREWRIPITERIRHDGSVAVTLDENRVRAVARNLHENGISAVAVSFMHSYKNPVHERRTAEILAEEVPDLLISISAEVAPEIREYERTSTTVANVYVRQVAGEYLLSLARSLREMGINGRFLVMLSDGGTGTADTATRFPIRILESGPAAGALAAGHHARRAGLDRLISFDMGGTTAKGCLVEQGRPIVTRESEAARVYRFKRGSGLPIKSPSVDLIEIGAGGGSIARLDRMNLLKVGPDSAGSDPGPACYGLGGEEPTVTDADLILGYLDAEFFLGGDMHLHAGLARKAIAKKLAEPLGLDPVQAAWGIHRLVNENMANAIRIHAIERGRDIRGYSLFAFGGAGPVHACQVAEILGLDQVVVPMGAGVASAFGMLCAPLRFHYVRSWPGRLTELNFSIVENLLEEMIRDGLAMLNDSGVPENEVMVQRLADMRYQGQTSEITVQLPAEPLSSTSLPVIIASFEESYRRLYHRTASDLTVEAVTWQVIVSGPDPVIPIWTAPDSVAAAHKITPKKVRPVYLRDAYQDVPVYDRYTLPPGLLLPGPVIVEERESTVVVTDQFNVIVDEHLNVTLRRKGS